MTQFQFEKANQSTQETIFAWLEEPHVKAFWDNSQAHKDDIQNFIAGRKEPSSYFDGSFTYWVGTIQGEPYCLLMTSKLDDEQDIPKLWQENLSQSGHSYSIDFCIGHKNYLGKGLASPTLQAFCDYIHSTVDSQADTFLIDPDENNPRAKHVYQKAGFHTVGNYTMGSGFFEGQKSWLMVKKLSP